MSFKIDDWLCSGTVVSTANGRLLLGIGERKWARRAFMDYSHSFFFPDYFLQSPSQWFIQPKVIEVSYEDVIEELEKKKTELPEESVEWESFSKEQFEKTFDELQNLMQENRLIKAVPYIIEKANYQMNRQRLTHFLTNILKKSKGNKTYVYGFWNHSEGILGATPEVLFYQDQKNKNLINTMACAGTKNESHTDESFISDPKEAREHRLVVSEIQNALSPLGDVNVNQLEIKACGMLEHLVTPISVNLHMPVDFDTLIKALHPTPALGAIPFDKGKEWLKDYNKENDRQRFGAPVGYSRRGNKEMTSYVAIRNMQWDKSNISIAAGCGIVKESKKENEWKELQKKLSSIKETLGL